MMPACFEEINKGAEEFVDGMREILGLEKVERQPEENSLADNVDESK